MVSAYRLKKEKQYPVPHDINVSFLGSFDDASGENGTIIPQVHYDEAMLASSKYSHPEHASFAESGDSNICAGSKVFKIESTTRITLNTAAIDTNKITAVRFAMMDIHGAFEDFDAVDELTSVTVGAVLELTKESTDRQTYPIWDTSKFVDKYTDSAHLGANAVGLTTDTGIEGVAFDPDLYYDALNYYTISEKLKKVQSGLRWFTLTRDNPTRVFRSYQDSSTKAANPYMFKGQLIHFPLSGTKYQIPIAGDTTNVNQYTVEHRTRFLEWNDNFHHEMA